MSQKSASVSEAWFSRKRLATKLRVLFLFQATLSVLIAVIGWPGLLWLMDNARDSDVASHDQVTIAEIRADLSVAYTHTENFMRTRRAANLDGARTAVDNAQAGVETLLAHARGQQADSVEALDKLKRSIGRLDGDIVALKSLGPRATDAELTAASAGLLRTGSELQTEMKAVRGRVDQQLDEFGDKGMAALFWMLMWSGGLGVLAVVTVWIAMRLTRNDVSRPLEAMATAMVQLADGDHDLSLIHI